MTKKEYFIGLDLGTNSVGWAVTDPQYNILRAKGKDMWGVREFDEASTAQTRRLHRTSRRRRQREQVRLGLIKDYFSDEILKKDPNFYARLENSKFYLEDKDERVRDKNGIFFDQDYCDKDYYAQYPTIYHLIMELIENPSAHDVRLVYLAIANLFKRRGHFLNASLPNDSGVQNMQAAYEHFVVACHEVFDSTSSDEASEIENIKEKSNMAKTDFSGVDASKIENILKSRNSSKTKKSEELAELFRVDKKQKRELEIMKAIAGRKVNAKLIFNLAESEEKIEFSFAEASFDDNLTELISAVGEENYSVIMAMREIYDVGSLAEIMHGHRYLSEARIADYKKHHEDLVLLKQIIKKYCSQDIYEQIFRLDGKGSYSAYVNSTLAHNRKRRRNMKERSREKFYEKIKSILGGIDDPVAKSICTEMGNETFMPKMLTPSNGIIPNQVHYKELKAILSNAEGYLPFLREKDESGLTTSERIQRLYQFRIPYFVGPTVNRNGRGNGWAVRKEEGMVLPWNIEEKIDLSKTKEAFIEQLIRKCTYISNERVLPKNALIYERFMVLNEINNIKINDERIQVELKKDIYNDLFKKGKKVTRKQLAKYLINRGLIERENQISGVDTCINSSLSSYDKFKSIFGETLDGDRTKSIVEDIIRTATIYGDDKRELKNILTQKYHDILTEEQIKRIIGYRFRDWGRLSKAFLEMEGCDPETGEITSLIQAMWNSNLNMMELLHSERYTFANTLQEKTNTAEKSLSEIAYEDLDEFYFSTPVKRMVWQTILLIKEITKIQGYGPSKIFIEMARSDEEKGDKGRKNSRAKDLMALYKNIKEERKSWMELIGREEASGRLKRKKMYLYIRQMGKDMYTGEEIDLDHLFDDNLYDTDHIYPKHFVKDDNLENNLVLVKEEKNRRKSDIYPLDPEIIQNPKVRSLWEYLHSKGFISDEKYRRLTSRKAFTEEELAGFIARQLVETRQATKGVADLLKELTDSEIVYSKARNVSDFRCKFRIAKSRLVNEFHHARDAYLNIVVGNAYYTKFTGNPLNYIRNEYRKKSGEKNYHLDKIFDYTICRNGYKAWAIGSDDHPGSIVTVKKMLAKNTPIVTRMTFMAHGKIADETIYGKSKAKADGYLPLKGKDPRMSVEKYGGFNTIRSAYFFLVEHGGKRKRVRSIETVPIYLMQRLSDVKELHKYCVESLGLVEPSIRLNKIKMQTLIRVNGYFVNITGRTEKRLTLRNAVNLILNSEQVNYCHLLEKYRERANLDNRITAEKNLEMYKTLSEKQNQGLYRNRPNNVFEKIVAGKEMFEKLSVEEQCKVLLQILNLTIVGKAQGDLKKIGASANTGVMLMSKTITKNKECKLINQSVTGLYETEIDLLTI